MKNFFYVVLMLPVFFGCASDPALELMEKGSEITTDANNDNEEVLTRGFATSSFDADAPVGFATVKSTPTGGQGGKTVTVTNATDLTNALKSSDKLIIYVKGTIKVNKVISVVAKNKTLLGLPGSVLHNPNRTRDTSGILYLKKGSTNLILRNLTFKGAGAYDTDGWDNLCIDGTTNIWVDHCDFQDGVDGNFDCKNASDNISVTWCRFRYLIAPKAGGSGGSNDHRFTNLWGSSDNATQDQGKLRTTFQFCWWDEGCRERMPRVRFGQIHISNCLYSSSVTNYCIGLGKNANVYVERTAFLGIKKAYDDKSNGSGKIKFDKCLFSNSTSTTGTGSSFTPSYTLPNTLAASKVEPVVRKYAGATLAVK